MINDKKLQIKTEEAIGWRRWLESEKKWNTIFSGHSSAKPTCSAATHTATASDTYLCDFIAIHGHEARRAESVFHFRKFRRPYRYVSTTDGITAQQRVASSGRKPLCAIGVEIRRKVSVNWSITSSNNNSKAYVGRPGLPDVDKWLHFNSWKKVTSSVRVVHFFNKTSQQLTKIPADYNEFHPFAEIDTFDNLI